MSKESKNHENDFYEGEQISFDDYYLDDEDYYLDDDIEEEHIEEKNAPKEADETGKKPKESAAEKESAGGGKKESEAKKKRMDTGSKEVSSENKNLEKSLKEPDAKKKSADRTPKESGTLKKGVDQEQPDLDIEPEHMNKERKAFDARQKKAEGKTRELAVGRKGDKRPKSQEGMAESGNEYQSDREDKNVEIQDREDMKKESAKKSGRADSGLEKTGKQRSSSGKKDTQKGGTGKSGPQRSNVAKSGSPKGGTGKSGGRKAPARNGKSSGRRKGSDHMGMKVAAVTFGVVLIAFAAAYIGISTYFMSHFYVNTEINGQDFSRKTVEDVQQYLQEQVQGYTLTILEKDHKTDTIAGEEISLRYEENEDIEKVLQDQNAFMWPRSFFVKNSSKATVEVSYDRNALENRIKGLQALKAEQIPPTSAYPKFNGTEFVIEPEVTGTEVDVDILNEKIHQYISEFKPELDMQEEGCYALPKYTSESGDVRAACNEMNQYLQASITYSMEQPVVVDRTLISNWVSADDNMQVTFNEGAVREWLREFGKQYDTVGKARSITSPYGKTVEVSGGTYGWSVDEDAEFTTLVNSIKNGEVVTKEPAYCDGQTAVSHSLPDWGNTYAEVDLSAQHMWFIVNGAVALDTDVVTGVPIPAKETPSGVYSILEKELNSTLVGEIDPATGQPEYRTVVRYWMRVTWSGIGFHDADWQAAFGGSLYANGAGSHGCINMPVDQAGALYDMLPIGTPVIIHY